MSDVEKGHRPLGPPLPPPLPAMAEWAIGGVSPDGIRCPRSLRSKGRSRYALTAPWPVGPDSMGTRWTHFLEEAAQGKSVALLLRDISGGGATHCHLGKEGRCQFELRVEAPTYPRARTWWLRVWDVASDSGASEDTDSQILPPQPSVAVIVTIQRLSKTPSQQFSGSADGRSRRPVIVIRRVR